MNDEKENTRLNGVEEKMSEENGHQMLEGTHSKRKSVIWRKIRWGMLVLFLLLFAAVVFLVTGNGQRTVLYWLSDHLDGFSLTQVEGSLQEGLILHQVRYQMDGIDVALGQAELGIDFQCLLSQKACISKMALRDSEVNINTAQLPPSKVKTESSSLGMIRFPIEMNVKELRLDNIKVNVDEMAISLDHFYTGLSAQDNQLSIAPTTLEGLSLILPAQAVDQKAESAKQAAKEKVKGVDWQGLHDILSRPLLNKLEPILLPIQIALPEFSARQIFISHKNSDNVPISLIQVSHALLRVNADNHQIHLETLEVNSDQGDITGQASLKLTDNYSLVGQFHASHPEWAGLKIPASQADLQFSGELFGKTHLTLKSEGAAAFKLNGEVQLAEPKVPFVLQLNSEMLRYPFMPENGSDPLLLKGLHLDLTGDLLNYQVQGKVSNQGMGLPSGSLELQGKGGLTKATFEQFELHALDGKAKILGEIDWSDGVAWTMQLNLQDIQTKSLLPEWAAVLSGGVQSSGFAGRSTAKEAWQVKLNQIDLNGQLLGKTLHLTGEASANPRALFHAQAMQLIYGENRIHLDGTLSENADFTAEINAPNLKGLLPHLSASIRGQVKMRGKLTEPNLNVDLVAENIVYPSLKLGSLSAKGIIAVENNQPSDLNLTLHQFSYDTVNIDNAQLHLSGKEQDHRLNLKLKGEPIGVDFTLSGGFFRAQQRWQGLLNNVILHTEYGQIRNDKAINVQYEVDKIRSNIGSHCWYHSQFQLCFPQAFHAGKEGSVPFELKQFNLAFLQQFLDKTMQIDGIVSAKGSANWFTHQAPQVNVLLTSPRIQLHQQLETGRFPLYLKPVQLNLNLKENNLNLDSEIGIENNGQLATKIRVNDLTGQRALSGDIQLNKLDLTLLKPLLTSGETVNGDLNARLRVGGTAFSPLLFGDLHLSGLKASSALMPFDILDGGLNLNFNGAKSTLKGFVKSPESRLNLSGDANWQKLDAWHTRIQAKADKFRLTIPDLAKIEISPNIEVKATPKALVLGGNIDIPWARVEVRELPESAQSVSSDEVIMDGSAKNKRSLARIDPQKVGQNAQGMVVNADVSINLGKDVRLEAYGLKTNVEGRIKVRQGNRGLGLYGQVNLRNGTFASFGQDLIIRKGLISFTGLPSQPTLDIEAIRNPEAMEDSTITAGVKVTGLADNLDMKVFSSPTMAQDQALSYILTGRGLDSDGASSNSVAAALIGLGLSKGSKTVGSVGSAFGITDLNVTTAGIGDNTKVVVSGSLTPKFKVKYGVGLFAPLTELTLRYRLAPSLYLQSVSSINQAIDLLYRFEFD